MYLEVTENYSSADWEGRDVCVTPSGCLEGKQVPRWFIESGGGGEGEPWLPALTCPITDCLRRLWAPLGSRRVCPHRGGLDMEQ